MNWESPQTGVKDYAQCSLPGTYILSGGQNIIDIVVIKLHYQHLLLQCVKVEISMLYFLTQYSSLVVTGLVNQGHINVT